MVIMTGPTKHREASGWRMVSTSDRIPSSWVRILLEAQFSSRLYGASLHTAFYYQLSITSILLKKCLRKIIRTNHRRWLSWMSRPTGDQDVAGSTPAEVGNILSWRLIMKYFLRSFSPFHWLSVSGERMCTILVNRLED